MLKMLVIGFQLLQRCEVGGEKVASNNIIYESFVRRV